MIIPLDQVSGVNPEDYFTPEEPQPQNLVPVSLAPSKMQENLSPTEEFGRGLGRGWEQVKGLGAGVVGMAGAATGIDGLEEWGYNKAQEKMQAAATPELEGGVGSIFNVESASDFVNYAAGVMGEQAPNLALSLMGGGLGGAVGKRAVSAAVTEALEAKTAELVAGGLARKVATERAKLELVEGLGQNMTANLAAEKAAQIAAMKTGVGVGGAAMGVGMEMSSIYNETRDLGLALKYGVPAGLIEGVADRYFGGKILDALNPATEVGAQVVKAGLGKTLGRVTAGVGMGALIEGPLEEVPQTRLEQMARAEADPNYDINSDASMRELVEAGAAGSIMGGGMAGGIEATKFALAPMTMRAQSNPEGLPDGTTPAPLTPEEQAKKDAADLEGLYNFDPNPVVIDDGDGEIVARKFNVGGKQGWALENPTDEQRALFPSIPGDRVAITAKSQYGGQLMHVLNQGGRIRRTDNSITDPSLLGSKVEDEGEWQGYDPNVQNNDLSGEQTGKNTKLDGELAMTEEGQKLALENAALAPYKELRNVFNAVDMLDSTFDPEIQASLLQDAVTPEEIEVAKSQLATAIAGAKTEEEINTLGELEQKISDFESTRTLKQATVPKSGTPTTPFFERDAEGNLNRVQRDTNADSERPTKVKMWADTVEQNAKAQADLDAARKLKANFDTGEDEGGVFTIRDFDADKVVQNTLGDFSSGRSDFRSDYFDGLETYEMMQADRADLEKKLKASKDPEVTKELTAKLAELEDAANSLNENLSRNDLFSRAVNSKISEAEGAEKNKAKLEQLRTLEAELQNLQSSRNGLITDEERSDFDASEDGSRLDALQFEVSSTRNSLISPKARAEIYKKAQAEVAAKRDEVMATREAEKAPREFVNAEERDAAARAEQHATWVYYTDPKTKFRMHGKLVADPETGKATNAAGNFLLVPDTNGFKKGTTGLSDLSDTRQYGAEAVELNPSQMANVALDKNKLMALEEARNAKDLGVEDTENKTPIQNATAAAQKQNELNKIQEEQRDNGLVPVDVVKLKRGDRIGLKFPDQEKVARTVYLNDGTQLVPTSAGIFSGTQTVNGERQAVFNRYYIARPKNTKGPSYLNSVTIPNLKKGESLITLNDISDEDKAAEGLKKNEAGVWQTGENVNEDLWGNFYKAPTTAVVEKRGDVQIVTGVTDAEQILALLLAKMSPNPTQEELLAIGLDQTDEQAEFEAPSGKIELAKMFNSDIEDPLSKSGLKIPVKVGLFSDKKNPNAPLQVRMFAAFDPSRVLGAMQNLQDKNNAPKSPQKQGNIAIAQKALDNEVQDLKRLTLAQMNMGLDVRVQEVNGIPETQMLEGLGFTASRSNIKKNDFGKHIITRLEYTPNPDYVGSEQVYTRPAQIVGKSQRQAAEGLKDETAGGKRTRRKKVGLGVANEALENFRRMQLERAQAKKDRREIKRKEGADVISNHGQALSRLTAFTRPLFEQEVAAIRKHIASSPAEEDLKDHWLMSVELKLAEELNKLQIEAAPPSVAKEWNKQRETAIRNAESKKPERQDNESKKSFERRSKAWKDNLRDSLNEIDSAFFSQILPRIRSGNKGVSEAKKIFTELDKAKEKIVEELAKEEIRVAGSRKEIEAAIASDEKLNNQKKQLGRARGVGAKNKLQRSIDTREAEIADSFATYRKLTEAEIEFRLKNKTTAARDIAQRKVEKLGEFTPHEESLLNDLLDFFNLKQGELKNAGKIAALEKLRGLFQKQKVAREGGRKIFINVSKADAQSEAAMKRKEALKRAKEVKKIAAQLIDETPLLPLYRANIQAEQIYTDRRSTIGKNESEIATQNEEIADAAAELDFKTAVSSEDKLLRTALDADNIMSGVDFSVFEDNSESFESALKEFEAKVAEQNKPEYSKSDKEFIRAFSRIMDSMKSLNIFGIRGKVPGLLKQGYVDAVEYRGAIESQTAINAETGEVVQASDRNESEYDPTTDMRMPDERLSSDEAKSQYLKDLAYRRLDQLARVKLNGFDSEVDQNLVELAFVKLFGGEFNGEVDGVEINKTFEPLDKKYTDVLNDFFSGTTANAEKENIARIEEARGRTPISDKDRQELTKGSRKIAATANNILDKYLFDISPVQASLGVPGAPLASLAQASTGASMARTAASPDIAQSNRDATALPKARINVQGLESSLTQARAAEKIAAEDVKTAQSSSEKAAAINALNKAKDNRIAAEMKVVEYNQSPTEEVQTFVQAYAGLSDSDMVALDDREIGAIYQAATSKADADMAVGAMDAVVAALPSIQQLENMTGGQLMSAYMADVKAQNDRGIAEKVLQDNLKNAANAKMFRSNTAFLEHVASMPKGINRATALRAKEFLKLNDKGSFNWNKIGTQIASFGKNGKQVNWAGVTGKDSTFKGGLAMYLNLDAVHDGNIVQTMLEEMDHVLTHQIIHAEEYGITLNPTQTSALERLKVAYKKAVLKAGEGMSDLAQAAEGLTPEQKVKFYAEGLLSKASENPERFRAYYNLTNLDEFVVGVKKDPAFLDLLKELGFNEKVDGGFSLSKFLKDIFHALAELVTGRRLDPASELARVFADSWTLSTGRDAKQFTVSPTQLSMALGIEGSGDTASTKKTGRTENVRMRQGNDGAIYNLSLVKEDDGSWSVAYEHGTPPRKLQQGKKNKTSLNYEQAKGMFDRTVAAKAKKYTIVPDKGPDGGSSATSPSEGPIAPAPKSLVGRTQESREGLRERLNTAGSERAQRLLRPISEDALDVVFKFYQAGFDFVRVDNLQNLNQFGHVKVLNSDFNFTLALLSEVDSPAIRPLIAWNPDLATRPSFLRELETAFRGVHGVTPNEGTRRLLFTDTGDNYYTQIGRLGYSLSNSVGTLALSDGRGGFGPWVKGKDLEESVEQARKVYEGHATKLPSPPDRIDINSESTALSQEKEKPRLISGKIWDALTKFDIFQYGRPLSSETTTEIYEKAYASVGNKGRGFSPDLATSETEAIKAGRKAVLKAVIDNLKSSRYKIEASWDGDGFALTLLDKQTSKKQGHIYVSTLPENKYVEIGSTTAKSKGKEDGGGKMLYQAAYDYTIAIGGQNTSSSLTPINRIRRTSNMFASALRHRTTKHLDPHPSQKISSNWMDENAAVGSNNKEVAYLNNLAILAEREMANVFGALAAEVQTWRYNFETGDYIDADRKDLTRERLDAAVQLGNPDESGVGMATLQRAIITNSAHNEFGGGEGESKLLDVSRGPKTRVAYSLPGALSRAQVSKLLTGSTESTTYTGTKVKTGGWFASDARAPNGVGAIYDRSVDRKALGEERAQYMATALQKALKRFEKAGNPVNIGDVQTALGTLENPLTEDQFAEVNELMLTNREEDAAVLKSEYMKENLAAFKARQAAASARLPESIAQIVGELRDVIDPMSRYVDETMGFSVKENEGVYLNRTYLNFADEKTRAAHQKNVRENAKVMEDLKNYVSRQLADREAGLLVRAATRRGEVLYIEEAVKIAQAGLTEADLAAGMEQYLNYGGDGIGRVFMSGKIPGQKNLKILDSRGNVAPELQAAWGVVKDPVVNYVNTTMKLSALVANDRLLRELKDVGMESGMLYDPRDPANLSESDAQIMKDARAAALAADPFLASNARFKPELLDRAMVAQDPEVKSILERSEAQIPAGYVKLSADTNKSLAPISGMFAEENFAKWMFEKFPAKGEDPLWLQGLLKATFLPMAMKTVGSVSGHFRNYYAGYMSLVAAGNFNPLDAQWRKDVAEAHALTFGRMLDSASDADKRKAMMKARAKLGELGLLNQSVMQNFMGDLAKLNSTSENGFKTFLRKVTQAYGASDDAFKIIHYFSELGKYRRAFPDMPIEQVEQKAAQIARDVHQTYGDTVAAVKSLKKIPVIAPFISFTSEVIRNSVNLVRLAHSEISEGRRTGNRELMAIGIKRVIGMTFAGGGTFAVASMFAAMAGVSGDEERDLRRLLPDWQKNSQLLFFGKSNGKISFMDFSFTDPFTYLKKPVIALARSLNSDDDSSFNERLADGVMGAVSELAGPFLGDQLFSGALLELKANKDSSGRSIYNPQDSGVSIAANITGHLAKVFTPGTFDTAGRMIKAASGVVSDSGRSYALGNEVMSAAGVRASEMDVRQSLGFKAKRFMQDYRDASSLFTGALLSRGTRSEGDVASGYNKANDAIRELSEDFRQTYIGAIRLGVPQREVISALKANGISDETIKMLQTGKIKPYEASKQAIKKAQESGAKDRIDAYNRTYAAFKKY